MKHAFCAIFIFQTRSRACLKNVGVAGYAEAFRPVQSDS